MRKRAQKNRGKLSNKLGIKTLLTIGNRPKKWWNGTKKEETKQQTENLKLFLKQENDPNKEETENGKQTQKWGNAPKKRETNQQTESLKLFLKTGKGKNEESDQKKRKLINKLIIEFFFWKLETDPKNEEMDLKKRGNRSTRIYNFFWKLETDPKMRKRIEKNRKPINKWRIENFFRKLEMDPKNEETSPKKEETNQ